MLKNNTKKTHFDKIWHTIGIWKKLECIYPCSDFIFDIVDSIQSIQHVQARNGKKCNSHPVSKHYQQIKHNNNSTKMILELQSILTLSD